MKSQKNGISKKMKSQKNKKKSQKKKKKKKIKKFQNTINVSVRQCQKLGNVRVRYSQSPKK